MAEIDVEINGKSYRLGCGDGEETRLRALVAIVDRHAHDLSATMGVFSDDKLFLMTALMVADELADVSDRLASLKKSQTAAIASIAPYDSASVERVADQQQESPTNTAAAIGADRQGQTPEESVSGGNALAISPEKRGLDPEIEEAFRLVLERAADRINELSSRLEAV